MSIMSAKRKAAIKEVRELLDPRMKEDGEGRKTVSLKTDSPDFQKFLKLDKVARKAIQAERVVPQSFLVSMVSKYDVFLSAGIKELFALKPEKMKSADKTMSVRDLVAFKSIEDAIKQLVEDDVEEMLRDSHLSQLQWVAKKIDFTIDTKDPLIERFIEVTERRNLFVHTDGFVSKQYLERCKGLQKEFIAEKKIGERVPINRKYMRDARNVLFETAFQTLQIAWRKARPDQDGMQNMMLTETIFDLLVLEDYALACSVSDFASTLRGIDNEKVRRVLCVNRAIAYKLSGNSTRTKEILQSLDWSASSASFKLAVAVLSDNISEVIRLMSLVPSEGDDRIEKSSYREWPLFKNLQNDEAFRAAFERKFGEPLSPEQVDVSVVRDAEEPTVVISDAKEPVIH